jgi:hypothetical protein
VNIDQTDPNAAAFPTEQQTPPLMLRADITRAELKALKALALEQDVSVQQLLASMIRERLAA